VDTNGNETVLYSFCAQPGCMDGDNPFAGVILDPAGNLYGTTYYGGLNAFGPSTGQGVVYKLDESGQEMVLYSFARRLAVPMEMDRWQA
jgi:uncharacterized repeat protein (TIGR03803 family)